MRNQVLNARKNQRKLVREKKEIKDVNNFDSPANRFSIVGLSLHKK